MGVQNGDDFIGSVPDSYPAFFPTPTPPVTPPVAPVTYESLSQSDRGVGGLNYIYDPLTDV